MVRPLALVGILATAALAQSFEVASVKPQPWTGKGSVGIVVRGNSFDAEHVSLFSLVTFAYNLRDVQLSGGPSWVKSGVLSSSELFQVTAKAPEGPPPAMDVIRQMLRTLLADRFKLQIRHVEKELPTYDLVVKKGGPKLKESPADAKFNFVTTSVGRFGVRIVATHMTVQQLIDHQLGGYTDQPIFDKTGLTAPYDFTLEFTVQDLSADNSPGLPALVTAVQEQLGLKLEPGRERFDTLVIEHAERPSEN
jgi:bla regulator protein blaR1